MKFLLIQEAGRHLENAQYREALCLARAIEREGHEAQVWGEGYPGNIEKLLPLCDAAVVVENYFFDWIPSLSEVKKLKIFWSIDGHCNLPAHKKYVRENKIDIVLNSCAPCVDSMRSLCGGSYWFPNAYPRDLFDAVVGGERTHALGFCGSHGDFKRSTWLGVLRKHHAMHTDINVLGDAMVAALRSYKISWNMNLGFDINYRTFESAGAGAMLLTNMTDGLSLLFVLGQEIVVYHDLTDCIEKILYYNSTPEEREQIALAGLVRVRKDHTYDTRARELIKYAS